jgi:hypothetical protein
MPNAKKLAIQKTGAKGEGVSGWWCAAEQENQSSIASNLDMAPRTKKYNKIIILNERLES